MTMRSPIQLKPAAEFKPVHSPMPVDEASAFFESLVTSGGDHYVDLLRGLNQRNALIMMAAAVFVRSIELDDQFNHDLDYRHLVVARAMLDLRSRRTSLQHIAWRTRFSADDCATRIAELATHDLADTASLRLSESTLLAYLEDCISAFDGGQPS